MTKDPLLKKIEEDILKTGFPLELRVADLLNTKGYYVDHSVYYLDDETKLPREADLRALKNYKIEDKETLDARKRLFNTKWVRNCLVLECKKSNKPWVFLSSKKNAYDKSLTDIPFAPKANIYDLINIDKLKKTHPFEDFDVRARCYFEAFNKGNDCNITGGFMTAVKATTHFMKTNFTTSDHNLVFYYPLVILEGQIFEGVLDKGKLITKEVNSVLCPVKYNTARDPDQNFTVPIITEKALPKFLDKLDKTLLYIGELAEKNKEKFFKVNSAR